MTLHRLACVWLLLAVAGLTGCDSSTFNSVPIPEAGCDARLVGAWYAIEGPYGDVPPSNRFKLTVSDGCSSIAVQSLSPDMHVSEQPRSLHLGKDGQSTYAWLDVSPSDVGEPGTTSKDATSSYVVRYEVSSDQLLVRVVDHRDLEHRIVNGDIFGTVELRSHRKYSTVDNQVDADLQLQEFREKVKFLPRPLRFVRQTPGASK